MWNITQTWNVKYAAQYETTSYCKRTQGYDMIQYAAPLMLWKDMTRDIVTQRIRTFGPL